MSLRTRFANANAVAHGGDPQDRAVSLLTPNS